VLYRFRPRLASSGVADVAQQAVPGPDWLVDRWERLAATYTADGDGNWREVDCERWRELDDIILRANAAFLLQRTANVKALPFACPELPAHEEGQRYEGLHRSVYRLFDRSDVEKNLKPGVRVLMEQYIVDLSVAMADCHKEAVKYMVNMPFTSVRPHFFVVETIFGMLFELPESAHSHLYYHVLIGDAVKMDPQRIAPILGRAIDLLYNRLDQLNMDCFDRFVEWFGFHLSNLKPFLELFLQTDVTEGDAAVFWDFACLPQHPRTEREQVFFQTGLHLVDTLYGFAAATVVQLKRLPPGFQGRPYRERGWCCFEEHVACLTKENNLLLDLSLFPQNVPLELERWEQKQKRLNPNMSVLDVCEPLEQRLFCIKDICMGGSHPPPTHPDELDEKLSRLSFTNKADSLTVSKIYRDLFFLTAAQTPDFLDLGCPLASGWQGWGLGEITSLARALPCFTRLQGLHLPGHPIGDEGLAVLCGALGEMPQLEDLELHDCVFGEEAFARAAPTLLKMKELMIPEWLQDTAAGKAFSRQWREAKNDPTLLEFYSNDIDSTSH
jgi:hypothetical protein